MDRGGWIGGKLFQDIKMWGGCVSRNGSVYVVNVLRSDKTIIDVSGQSLCASCNGTRCSY